MFKAADDARKMSAKSNVQDWNQATNLVITGKAGGQIMGDWAQGEFQVAGQVAGKDYTCLPGLGVNEIISTGGDAFYFPLLKDRGKVARRRKCWPRPCSSPTTQVAFNLKKGSLPVRGDVDLAAANDCMKKGLDILAKGNVIPGTDQLHVAGHATTRSNDLFAEFFADSDDDAGRRAEALRRHHRGGRVNCQLPNTTGAGLADSGAGDAALQLTSAGRSHDRSHDQAPQPAVPESERQDRLDPDDPDRRWSSSSAAPLWTVFYSFTNSKLLPRLTFVGLDQYERLWSTPRWLVSIENLAIYGVLSLIFSLVIGFLLAALLDQKIRFEDTFRTIFLYPFALSFIVTGLSGSGCSIRISASSASCAPSAGRASPSIRSTIPRSSSTAS